MKNPSKTAIIKILRECVFDPREPGPMKIIADVGNQEYFITRAIELLSTEKQLLIQDELIQAIRLLVLAKMANQDRVRVTK
jgi:hypothetical protein